MGYYIDSISGSGAVAHVSPESGYAYYKVYWRKTSDQANQESEWINGAPSAYPLTGLDPNTSYTINVGYNNTGTGGADGFMGAQAFYTLNPIAHIHANGQWHSATPFVYTGGQWKPADAKVYTGGRWHG